jgi:hypothetical protein
MTEARPRRRRRHAALDSRIVATGVAACATFGIVIGMAVGRPPAQQALASPDPTVTTSPAAPAPGEVIIIKRRYVPADGAAAPPSPSTDAAAAVPPAPAPAPVAPPPATTSGGS